MYKFSAPMPYQIENIDKILDINNQVEKSCITSLYASLPETCELFTGFEQYRNLHLNETSFEYWKKLFSFCLEKGVDFIYLLNSPRNLKIESPDFPIQIEKLHKLLEELRKIGINKLRVANPKLMTYLSVHYPEFQLYASTSFEFKTIKEHQNFLQMHQTVKQIVPSHDLNKNFKLLKNLKKSLPNIEIELMVNEGCISGCAHRFGHSCEIMDRNISHKHDFSLSNHYYTDMCYAISNKNVILQVCKGNHIYPWEIEEYSKIGINNFKLVGRDGFQNGIDEYLNSYLYYFKGIDNIKNIENITLNSFIHHLARDYKLKCLTVKEVKHFLPQIYKFKKNGHLCSSICGVECKYCFKCAEKINKILDKKHEKQNIKNVSSCFLDKKWQVENAL